MKTSRAVMFVLLLAAVLVQPTAAAANPISVEALGSGEPPLTATDLAQQLVGTGVTIENVTYTGVETASGRFSGGEAPVGFASGVLLTSGHVDNVVGPNDADGTTMNNGVAGDTDLNALASTTTHDASVLEFDFEPTASQIFFRYVFGSEEYNEFVYMGFNDVFGFFVNDGESTTNCAVVPETSTPVSIDTINGGQPFGNNENASHPELYRNNDVQDDGGAIDTELDGLTTVLTCTANVVAGQSNHVKLAIADAGDGNLDSAVFLETGSFSTEPPTQTLTVDLIGEGGGEVTDGEGGQISCTESGDPEFDFCEGEYENGTTVQLFASPDETSTFAGWTGCDSFEGEACSVTMNSDRTVTAQFDPIVEEQADLAIDSETGKVDEPEPVSPGGTVRYTVTVDNLGPDDATGVEVTDTISAGTVVGAAGAGWSCSFEGTTATCTGGAIPAGDTADPIEIDVQAPSTGGSITDTATITAADQSDPNETNNSASETTMVRAATTNDAAATFCLDSCTLTTDPNGSGATPGDQTVTTLIVQEGADPQTVSIAEDPATTDPTFCGNQRCNGQIVTITGGGADGAITGEEGSDPIIVKLVYDKSVKGGTQIYFKKGAAAPKLVPNCTTPGVASPHPCVSTKVILPGGDKEITVLMLFGDPSFGKR